MSKKWEAVHSQEMGGGSLIASNLYVGAEPETRISIYRILHRR